MAAPFRNRAAASRFFVKKPAAYAGRAELLRLALPRGGVPVAFKVSRALHAPPDVYLLRKLGLALENDSRLEQQWLRMHLLRRTRLRTHPRGRLTPSPHNRSTVQLT